MLLLGEILLGILYVIFKYNNIDVGSVSTSFCFACLLVPSVTNGKELVNAIHMF